MTREYLLDAIGLIDDDLIQDAEVRSAPVVSFTAFVRRWGSLAACLALVLTLSYVFLSSGGMKKSEAPAPAPAPSSSAPAASAPASSAPAASEEVEVPSGSASTDSSAGAIPSEPQVGTVFLGSGTYHLLGEFLDELPEGCRSLDTLVQFCNGAPSPSTDVSEYVGCALWTDDPNPIPTRVYVQLSDRRYAVAVLVQP